MVRNVKMVVFDMDGTLADFYSVPNWLHSLEMEDASPYQRAKALWPTKELGQILAQLLKYGVDVRIVTWLARDSSETFKGETRKAKREWLEHYAIPYAHFHGVKYGSTKADAVRRALQPGETAILFDDNAKICKGWNLGPTFNPQDVDIIQILEELLEVVENG